MQNTSKTLDLVFFFRDVFPVHNFAFGLDFIEGSATVSVQWWPCKCQTISTLLLNNVSLGWFLSSNFPKAFDNFKRLNDNHFIVALLRIQSQNLKFGYLLKRNKRADAVLCVGDFSVKVSNGFCVWVWNTWKVCVCCQKPIHSILTRST